MTSELKEKRISGPCIICGKVDYELSCGGPTICPSCDCGNFTPAAVAHQMIIISELEAALSAKEKEVERLRHISDDMLERIVNFITSNQNYTQNTTKQTLAIEGMFNPRELAKAALTAALKGE